MSKTYYIPSMSKIAAKSLRTCVTCKRAYALPYRYPNMPNLPSERDTLRILFNKSLEMPDHLYIDTSSSFRANCQQHRLRIPVVVSQIHCQKRTDFVTNHKIVWKFTTRLPWWRGGFYERLYSLLKSAFTETAGRSLLPLEALHTTTVEIEAVISSRPLTPFRDSEAFEHILNRSDFISPEANLQLPSLAQNRELQGVPHKLAEWYKDSLRIDTWYNDYLSALRELQISACQAIEGYQHQAKRPGPRFTDMLAKYEIQFSDILDAFTFATAILAETHKLLDQLSQQHFQQLLQEKEQAALAIARVSTP
ncbi:unnamed protein product [Heligmosomoides polygyrus]|uniref:Integrase catalytic domain-containing protein n=1 Tax=Heligmosomoides polygyrus TaxID=6339 RepID=A0A3P7WMF1_HELPZ|nr:unnamed protein product [Heligmosomoides polygyrus]